MDKRENKVVLFGSTGRLGRELAKIYDFISPTHHEVDITDFLSVKNFLNKINPSKIIHAAALVGAKECEENKEKAYNINVIGTYNIAKICQKKEISLIYISTDTVFDGEKGDYTEEDTPNPINYYSLTKLLGECCVKMLEDYLIIRTSFFSPDSFPYRKVFTDQYTCRMPANDLAKEIILAIEHNLEGIIHIAGEKDSLYNIIKKYDSNIEKTTRVETGLILPRDLSLNTTKWGQIKSQF